jgi:hypothetical protein
MGVYQDGCFASVVVMSSKIVILFVRRIVISGFSLSAIARIPTARG